VKRIGVLTSGGDSPGMNAAIRAVVRAATAEGVSVLGFEDGFRGLLESRAVALDRSSVSDVLDRGGTFLGSGRSSDFRHGDGVRRALEICRDRQVEGLVVIGGDGSLRGAHELDSAGLPSVGIPATIDNDLTGTDYCIGFDTALNTIIFDVSKIRDTASAMDRIFVIEVMGRDSGMLALHAGLACGADALVIPEVPPALPELVCRISEAGRQKKMHFIVLVAEGAASAEEVGRRLHAETEQEVRVSVLGYIQRGGAPSALDRILASRLGARAVELLLRGARDLMAGVVGELVMDVGLEEATATRHEIDESVYRLVMTLSS